jgi:hypothetical protein
MKHLAPALGLLLLGALILLPRGGTARRLPSTLADDTVRIAATDSQWREIVLGHAGVAFIEPPSPSGSSAWRGGERPIRGLRSSVRWTSRLIAELAVSEDGTIWRGTIHEGLPEGFLDRAFLTTLGSCLSTSSSASWPGAVLAQAGVAVEVSGDTSSKTTEAAGEERRKFTATFSAPVGVLPELLIGCFLESGSPVAPYSISEGELVARPNTHGREPLIGRIVLERSADRADLQIDAATSTGQGDQIPAPSDVLLLLAPVSEDSGDPLGLRDLSTKDRSARMAVQPLLTALHLGRGGPASTLLPPGLGPSWWFPRSTARPSGQEDPGPAPPEIQLADASLSAGPSIRIDWPQDDPLLTEVAERLALLARSSGRPCTVEPGGYQLLRFRPRSSDPALALLELAALSPDLAKLGGALVSAKDLLSLSPSARALAAINLERYWLSTGKVVPLMTTQHWFATKKRLHGVELGPSGTPSLLRAWTSSQGLPGVQP